MYQVKDGMNYAPQGKPAPVVKPGEFIFAAACLDHGHIYGMCTALIEAGATLKAVYDPDPAKVEAFQKRFGPIKTAACLEELLDDPEIQLIAGAAVTSERCALGVKVMQAGKDYFTDKAPLTTLEQLQLAKATAASTGRKYMVYYSERLHVEGAVYAGQLIDAGEIGQVLQVIGVGPHRLSAPSRPKWFFEKEKYGGILCDIGSHQIEQYLAFTGEEDARVVSAHIANYANPAYPELDDFGSAELIGAKGTSNYFRVDWFTPDGLRTWGDGRTLILGTKGFVEIRKYVNIGQEPLAGNHVFLVNQKEEKHFEVSGKVGYPFFGQLILDCLNRTEKAMTQAHAFKAAELCVKAQLLAEKIC